MIRRLRRPTPRQLAATVAVLVLLLTGAAFAYWLHYAPRPVSVTAGAFPEELVYVRSTDDVISGGSIFTPEFAMKLSQVEWVDGR